MNNLRQRLSGLFWLRCAHWLERRGLPMASELCLRQITGQPSPQAAEAAFLLSQSLLARDRNQEAADLLTQALANSPQHARAWCALGAARRRLADMPGARAALEQALAIRPDYAQALNNLGEWLLNQGQAEAALGKFDLALASQPHLVEACNNRIAALYELARYEDAEAAAKAAIARHPEVAAPQVNLGTVLLHGGKSRQAAKAYMRALEIDPACPEALLAMAMLLGETQHLSAAVAFIEREIESKGVSAQRLAALALAQQAKGDLPEAEATCLKLLEHQPGNIAGLVTLAGCYSGRGDHSAAMAACRRALETNANMPGIFSNIAFAATYRSELDPHGSFAVHREWAQRFEAPRQAGRYWHTNRRDTAKRLRIGYISGDLGRHPVGFLLRDVLKHHDRQQVEVHIFSMMRKDDEVTVDIRAHADTWHDVLLDSDDTVAQTFHQTGIDILVDLSGHTAYNRLAAFALKPAPVQVSWIGYFHSTGLDTIDYYISDPYTTPRDTTQPFSETPVWLPHSRFCYSPPQYSPAPAPSPVARRGHITFGCFNRPEKMGDEVKQAWAAILHAVPESRLLLKGNSLDIAHVATKLLDDFAALGIDRQRIELRGRSSHADMLNEYADMDIALDPFPFNGGMTTMEALWMSVPLIAVRGQSVVSRQSYATLANIGLADLTFADIPAYIDGAIALARDQARLTRLRSQIRSRLMASPIMDGAGFCHGLECLYRDMWRAWCAGQRLPAFFMPTLHQANDNSPVSVIAAPPQPPDTGSAENGAALTTHRRSQAAQAIHPDSPRHGQLGFTLVELIVTLVIVGILAVFLAPRMNLTAGFDEKALHDGLKAGLDFARKSAVAKRRNVCVNVASNAATLTFDTRQPETAGASFCNGSSEQALPLPSPDAKCAASNIVCGRGLSLTCAPASFRFDALGRASAAITCTTPGQANITIESETGYVH